MREIYLQSMTDFVLKTESKGYSNLDCQFFKIQRYANFLKQPLQLGFFVPCDENGNVLSEPIYSTNHSDECYCKTCEEETKRCSDLQEQYYNAKERVLLKGFRLIANSNIPRIENGHCAIFLEDIAKTKIEDLLQKWDALELTENAIKQIGL